MQNTDWAKSKFLGPLGYFAGWCMQKITCADVSLATLADIHNELIVGGLSMTATRTEKDWIIAGVSPEKISGKLGLRIM